MKNNRFICIVLVIGIITFFISKFVFSICVIHGDSMKPTLNDKSLVIETKIVKRITNGDIIVIKRNNIKIIKRVIGIPGDKVVIKDNYVFVNDIKYDDFITTFAGILDKEIILGDDDYIVLGDNRKESIDSRYEEIGIIKKDEIIGKIYN